MAWRPGESGNPAGRKPNRIRERFMELAEPHVPEIVSMLVEAAKKGDVQAAAALLDRVWPKLKPADRPAAFEFSGATFGERGEAILTAIAEGQLSVADGSRMIECLQSLAKLAESDEIERRLKTLEDRL